ncbi:type I-E CRISPR-associated protein Cas5/CasD [Jatrophihabitans lederbergiae]|uniref:Type I-E CRISPR-associated protein Cas5/CasD n=1 Tax=Jatrophihabitans lederbergiae TaxID=3075547 RepID=A0ABU2JFL1_9ACTN|nr:type I-E CRISPR-associated protein Cas5/CasD [Jatrophihabitans sp. DSM 44399]MDT0263791.1 type I-E CRISPR-associated protein Cas5/CasD [Jatrophihabitans sp. DSM 44399]
MPDGHAERTLVLRLAGPLQSWGLTGQFIERDTASHPTKSGVIGMLAAALGRARGEDISDLTALRFGVRVDRPGVLLRDYHTISHHDGTPMRSADGKLTAANTTKITHRYYLSDAVFLVGLNGSDPAQLDELSAALRRPVYAPFLGRKSCVPAGRIDLGVHDGGLVDVLSGFAWHGGIPGGHQRPGDKLHLIVEDTGGADLITDVPTNFDPKRRGFQSRRINHLRVALADPTTGEQPDFHDLFSLIGW